MSTKVNIASNPRVVNSLLVSTQPVHLVQLAFVGLPDIVEQSLLLLEPLLGCLKADEGGCPYIAGGNGVVEGKYIRRDIGQVRRRDGHVHLGNQAGWVFNVF